jgi:hypothetical protein
MTIGPALVLLALIEPVQNRITVFFVVFGRVPLFYFIVHFIVIHFTCMVLFFASGHSIHEAYSAQSVLGFRPVNFGYSLPVVYLIWMGVVLAMYPLCSWYGRYKYSHRQWWLSYL